MGTADIAGIDICSFKNIDLHSAPGTCALNRLIAILHVEADPTPGL